MQKNLPEMQNNQYEMQKNLREMKEIQNKIKQTEMMANINTIIRMIEDLSLNIK